MEGEAADDCDTRPTTTEDIVPQSPPPPSTPTVDDLLPLIKPFGRYQWLITFLYTYSCFAHLCNMQFMGFSGQKPLFWCRDTKLSCHKPSLDCGLFKTCSEGNLTFVHNFHSIVEEWSLVCDRSYYASVMTTAQMIGVLFGGLVAGPITDICGRKWTYIGTLTLELMLGGLSSACTSWKLFVVFRFFIGFALGGALVCGWVFAAEITTNRYRLIIRAVGGAFLAQFDETVIAYLTRDWRLYSIIGNAQVLPLLPLLALFTHESPRWLLEKGRVVEAEKVLHKIAKFNKTAHFLPVNIFKSKFAPSTGRRRSILRKYFAWELFRSRQMTKYTLALMITYFSLSTINYGMFFGIDDLPFDIYAVMTLLSIVSILELPVAFYDAHNVKVNRKYLLLGSSALAVVANIAVTALLAAGSGDLTVKSYDGVVSAISVIGQLLSNVALDIAYMYSIELYPTLLRCNAGAMCSIGSRLGSILAPQLIYFDRFWTPLPYCCFSIIGTVGIVFVAWILPNTKNLRLPETDLQSIQ